MAEPEGKNIKRINYLSLYILLPMRYALTSTEVTEVSLLAMQICSC